MRKRSKYRPKPVVFNTMGYVKESLTPVSQHAGFMVDLNIKNHAAMTLLTQGQATPTDIDTLIQMVNICEALYRLGFGRDYGDIVVEGLAALRAVGRRGHETKKFILRAAEMNALNTILELHDAQLQTITLKDMEKAIFLVREDVRLKKTTPIVEKT